MDDRVPDNQQSIVGQASKDEAMEGQSLTLRAVVSGLLIGILVNLSNTYYGLRIGAAGSMSMVSGLLGYVGFKSISRYTNIPFSPAENVLVISTATATGCMPVTAGFIGMIPALEYLIGPDDNGPVRQSFGNLILWSMGLCFFGIIFASLFRERLIEREKLPWPGARATAYLIKTLHNKSQKLPISSRRIFRPDLQPDRGHDRTLTAGEVQQDSLLHGNGADWKVGLDSLLRGALASGAIV